MRSKISVVIPVYNRFEYLPEALKSVFDQDPTPDEVIVVDDCSSESLSDYLRKYPPPGEVRILRTDRNRRVAGARNWGWRQATGNLIAFIDSDDIWEPGKLRRQLKCLEADPSAAGVYGSTLAFWPNGRTEVWADDRPPVVDLLSALIDHNITVQSLLIRREALEILNGFDERFSILDDQDLAIRIARARLKVVFFPDPPLVRHRRHDSNHSSNAFTYFREECLILRQYRHLCDRVYGPGSSRVWLGRALRRLATNSRVTRIPASLLSSLLHAAAPSSAMPRELWQRRRLSPRVPFDSINAGTQEP
jgi:glycosyltransferase involved in cell wall biosynthesis